MFNSIKLAALLFFVGSILLPVPAEGQCSKTWDASGVWEIRQGKGGKRVIRLELKQSGSGISGKASRDGMTGDVVGDTGGGDFSIAISWKGFDEMNVYRAQVSATGKLSGETYIGSEKRSPDTWYSDQPLTCGWTPGKSRGNLTGRLSANDTARPGQGVGTGTRVGAPFLAAGQVYYTLPQNPIGQAALQWDAGTDHPNAEVWVYLGDSRERTMVAKQSKGGQQIQVIRGVIYRYALIDGRNILATAVVVGQ